MGERTPRQRLVTYLAFALGSAICTVIWALGTFDEPRGIGPVGLVVFPIVAIIFAARAREAWRETRREPGRGA